MSIQQPFGSKEGKNVRPFNLNSEVKVKLTERGIQILKSKHDELFEKELAKGLSSYEFKLELDEEGYYTTQMWKIMQDLGEHVSSDVFESTEFLIPENPKSFFL